MSKKNLSQILFEEFCANSRIEFVPIKEGETRTPDYEIIIDGQRIIVEVKEIDRNNNEKELLRTHGYEEGSGTPGDRVRRKIKKASSQIKALTQEIYPSILVLLDLTWGGHLDQYYIKVAMYGLEQIHLEVPINPSLRPYTTGMSFGPERQMTEEHNKSISAIGSLLKQGPNEIILHVYHNKYAAVPINPNLLAEHGIKQFRLENEEPGYSGEWEELAVQN